MGAEPHLVVLSDHPSLHRGFATVAREVADHLHLRAGLALDYVGYYQPAEGWSSPGYRVFDLESEDDLRSRRVGRLRGCLEQIAREHGESTLILLGIGSLFDLESIVTAVDELGLRRRVRLVGYTPIDYAPVSIEAADVFRELDVLVPFTEFARASIQDVMRRAGVQLHNVSAPIPHGVDSARFRPLCDDERRVVRHEYFNVADDEVLIGFFGRNAIHKRTDLVLRIVQPLLDGSYATCTCCGTANACGLHPDGDPARPPDRCSLCDSSDLRPGRPRPAVRVYMHTDHQITRFAPLTGGRDLEHIASRLGIRERVQFRDDLRIGYGDSLDVLRRRMAACDVHLLPYDCAGWELTVLETGACGIPNVITETAGPPTYAAPFSRVIPVATHVMDDGARGMIDVDLALSALIELVDDPAQRTALGAQGPPTARLFDWRVVGERWAALIVGLAGPAR